MRNVSGECFRENQNKSVTFINLFPKVAPFVR